LAYCTKCGEKNSDSAKYCVKCGANLEALQETSFEKRFEDTVENFADQVGKRMENECFGLPRGGAIFGLLIGIIIIIVGLQQVFEWQIDVGPLATIIVGLLFVAGAIYGLTRRRS